MLKLNAATRLHLLGASALLLALGCTPSKISKPIGPDMQAFAGLYETPTAAFDPNDADELRIALSAFDLLLDRTEIASYLFDILEQVVGEADADADDDGNDGDLDLTLEADGYFEVTRICNGWVTPPVPDAEANGVLELTATFSERGLDPVIWGGMTRCRYLVGETRLELRQLDDNSYSVSVYWGEGIVDLETFSQRPLLFALNMQGVLGDEVLDLAFDFRTLTGREIEYRLQQGGGSIIASLGDEGTLTLRAANGNFDCPDGMPCTRVPEGAAGE